MGYAVAYFDRTTVTKIDGVDVIRTRIGVWLNPMLLLARKLSQVVIATDQNTAVAVVYQRTVQLLDDRRSKGIGWIRDDDRSTQAERIGQRDRIVPCILVEDDHLLQQG